MSIRTVGKIQRVPNWSNDLERAFRIINDEKRLINYGADSTGFSSFVSSFLPADGETLDSSLFEVVGDSSFLVSVIAASSPSLPINNKYLRLFRT